jgi:hypothetical protein
MAQGVEPALAAANVAPQPDIEKMGVPPSLST